MEKNLIDDDEIIKRLEKLAEHNWKVKNLLDDIGAFHTWSEHLQDKLLMLIHVARETNGITGSVKFFKI